MISGLVRFLAMWVSMIPVPARCRPFHRPEPGDIAGDAGRAATETVAPPQWCQYRSVRQGSPVKTVEKSAQIRGTEFGLARQITRRDAQLL